MLNSKTRSQLRKRKWVDIEKGASNPSQKLKRIRDESVTVLDDLRLIAEKIPDGIQEQIFTRHTLEPLINDILRLGYGLTRLRSANRLDARRTQLCAMLMNKCANYLQLQYAFLEHNSPVMSSIVSERLNNAVTISNEIAYKVELLSLRNIANKTKLEYVFNWKKVTEKDERLWSYLYGELGVPFTIEKINRTQGEKALEFKLLSEFDDVIASVNVVLGSEDDKATLVITDGSTDIKRELVAREENGELYVFKRINKS